MRRLARCFVQVVYKTKYDKVSYALTTLSIITISQSREGSAARCVMHCMEYMETMNGENRQLGTDEPVEFEK